MKTTISIVLMLCASTSFAAGGVVINGDLTLEKETPGPLRSLYFSNGTSQFTGQPWGFNNLDLYYLDGKVGIGKINPSTALDVNGTVTATGFSGNGSGLTNVTTTILDDSITTNKIANGAVTDAKITGLISAAKLDFSTVQKKYGKVAVVAKSGGDYSDPVTAMAGVATWCGTPSAANPCLLKIMPGVYDLGSGTLVMQQYVDIEGSGELATTITSAAGGDFFPIIGVVNGASYAEIRFLTIRNSGTANIAAGMVNDSYISPRMSHITINLSGGGYEYYGVYNLNNSSPVMNDVTVNVSGGSDMSFGIYNYGSSPAMNNIKVSTTGPMSNYGVYNYYYSSPVMNNVSISAKMGESSIGVFNYYASAPVMTNVTSSGTGASQNYGMYNIFPYSAVTIIADRSTFEGSTNSIRNDDGWTLQIGASRLIGPRNTLGTYIFSGAYDDSGTVTANAFSGNGAALTNVNASTVANGVYTTGSYADPAWITSLAGSKITGGISGNAGTVTNGVYTTGNYANPTWITSLAGAKITGNISGNAANVTGTVAIANGGTGAATAPAALASLGGVSTTGSYADPAWITSLAGSKITGTINASNIPDGAVTDIKITGPISAAKLDLTKVQKKYSNVAVVALGGGDYADPVSAMTGLSTWCGIPSAANPCLLKIMPGVYNLGGGTLVMQPYVDIEGAGEFVTVITSAVNSGGLMYGTVNGASNAEIRFLTIKATGTGMYSVAMINSSSSPRMSSITVNATGVTDCYGVYNQNSSPVMNNVTVSASAGAGNYGVYNNSATPVMNNVIVTATGGTLTRAVLNMASSPVMNNVSATASLATTNYGVFNSSSSPSMTNVIARGLGATNSYGMFNTAPSGTFTLSIDRSTFEGATNSILNESEYTLRIGASRLIGPRSPDGTYILSGVYDNSGTVTAAAFAGNGAALTNVNASTVTNGVYTTGSYADPAWITSLAGSKITGTVAIANGGTGATNVIDAISNLGAVATFNSYADPGWITSLAARKITGAVAIANGGTGETTAAAARTSLGAVAKTGDTMTGGLGLPADGLDVGHGQLTVSGGMVGIGTPTPSEALTVQGNITASGTGAMPTYINDGTAIVSPHAVTGNISFTDGTIVVLKGSAIFTSVSSYTCTAMAHGIPTPAIGIQYDRGDQFTLLADGSTVTASYICVGN